MNFIIERKNYDKNVNGEKKENKNQRLTKCAKVFTVSTTDRD